METQTQAEEALDWALAGGGNDFLLERTSASIRAATRAALESLYMPAGTLEQMCFKLRDYRLVDDPAELKHGQFLRWICLHNIEHATPVLARGGMLCEIRAACTWRSEPTLPCMTLVVKSTFNNAHWQISVGECLLFQRLSDQERIVIAASDLVQQENLGPM
jgi:hypothetical protein